MNLPFCYKSFCLTIDKARQWSLLLFKEALCIHQQKRLTTGQMLQENLLFLSNSVISIYDIIMLFSPLYKYRSWLDEIRAVEFEFTVS